LLKVVNELAHRSYTLRELEGFFIEPQKLSERSKIQYLNHTP